MNENRLADRMNTQKPQPYISEVVTSLFRAAITTISKHGLSTTPRLPDMAVVARDNCRPAPALRSSSYTTPPTARMKIPEAPVNAVGKAVAKIITEASIGAGKLNGLTMFSNSRSEERRVGKECRSRWSRDH